MSRNGVASEARSEVKRRLDGAVEATMIDLGSLARQINRGSKSSEIVVGTAKAFASLEANVENTDSTLKRMGLVAAHLSFQADAIQRGVQLTPDIQDSLNTTVRTLAPPHQTTS